MLSTMIILNKNGDYPLLIGITILNIYCNRIITIPITIWLIIIDVLINNIDPLLYW